MTLTRDDAPVGSSALPKEWELKRVGEIGRIKTGPFGTLLKASEYAELDGVPLISVREVGRGKLRIDDRTPLVPVEVVKRLPEYLLRAGDIVFGRKGAVDRSAIVGAEEDGWFLGSDGIRLRLEGSAYPPFYAAQFQSPHVQNWLLQNATGTTMASLNQQVLARVPVVAPPLSEQKAIATALGDWDDLLLALDKIIGKKREIKLCAMRQLLTGEARLAGFTAPWGEATLANVCAFITKGTTPTTFGFKWENEGVLFLRSECVAERGLDLSQAMFISEDAHDFLGRSEIKGGDLVMTITGNVGRTLLLNENFGKANINQHIARIRLSSDSFDPRFVAQHFQRPEIRKSFDAIVTGQAYPQISLKQVRELKIPMPERDEQIEIAEILGDMDADIIATETRMHKMREVRAGMMQQLLTGRIRLA